MEEGVLLRSTFSLYSLNLSSDAAAWNVDVVPSGVFRAMLVVTVPRRGVQAEWPRAERNMADLLFEMVCGDAKRGTMIVDYLEVDQKNNDETQYIWESSAGGCVTMQGDIQMVRGKSRRRLEILCCSKEDQADFVEKRRVRESAKKLCELIGSTIHPHVEILCYLEAYLSKFLQQHPSARLLLAISQLLWSTAKAAVDWWCLRAAQPTHAVLSGTFVLPAFRI